MSNAFDQVRDAVEQAEAMQRACNENANRMAALLRGRLRHVSSWNLEELKRELRNYNIHTGSWK